ncbi:MAG: PD-(D/E)XK nuclease family protein [Sphingobacteriales bacterium]|nr:MAG: PD-(D/E)XK nuclease family protein [Sphingobacteriales bacterium]
MLASVLYPYLQREAEKPYSGESLLFRILVQPDFGNDPVDLARLLLYRRSIAGRKGADKVPLMPLLENPLVLYSLGLTHPEILVMTGQLLSDWVAATKRGERVDPETLPLAALRARKPDFNPNRMVYIDLPEGALYKGYLRQMALSVSTLNKFLRCPLQFYYENILKVVTTEPVYFTFGKVMHTVLEEAFRFRKAQGVWPTLEAVLNIFELALEPSREELNPEAFEGYRVRGKSILERYYAELIPEVHTDVEIEYVVPRVLLENRIPLTGRIDKLEFYPGSAKVVDYKTGNAENAFRKSGAPSPDNPLGGDYWRQMVFYKLLVEAETGQHGLVKTGVMEFLEREVGAPVREEFTLTEADGKAVRQQVKEVWRKIQAGQFDRGCGRETCEWCGLVREAGIGVG